MKKKLIEKIINSKPENNVEAFVDSIIELERVNFNNSELIPLVKQSKNNDLRCWALLKINYITNIEDAEVIVDMLSAKDSRQRELASEIIYRHISCQDISCKTIFADERFYYNYTLTIKDINPRVTRNIIACYKYLKQKDLLFSYLINAIKNFDGYYVYYWALEGMTQIIECVNPSEITDNAEYLNGFFNKIIAGQEDLLKEKVAIVLPYFIKWIDLKEYQTLVNNIYRLKNNKNFYVKQAAEKVIIY